MMIWYWRWLWRVGRLGCGEFGAVIYSMTTSFPDGPAWRLLQLYTLTLRLGGRRRWLY